MVNFLKGASVKTPQAKVKIGSGVPGDSSRARVNEASGQKVTPPAAGPMAAPKTQQPRNVGVASGDNIVMPVDHPLSTTTRTVSKGGTL